MSDQTDSLLFALERLGLNSDEATIYLYLLEKSVATALDISRNLHLGRTKVYRLLDKLIEKKLVVQKLDSAGLKFISQDPSLFNTILANKESELLSLKNSLPKTILNLNQIIGTKIPGSQVLYYHGQRGLSQVNWNLLKARGEIISYEITTADIYLPQKEAEQLRQGLVDNKIQTRTITNKKLINAFTEITELVEKWWQIKYLSINEINITSDVFIYNDIFAVCNYADYRDVFCFEVQNQLLSQMQKEIFENLWKQAKSLTIVNRRGKTILPHSIHSHQG